MRIAVACLVLGLSAAPALADVRSGVDAWNRKDYSAAIAQWRAPANAGDADAQYNLAQAYRRGLGVPQDDKLAQEWYRKAADKDHVQAQASLALILFQSQQRAAAFPLLEKAAAKGETRAQYVLATALFNGDGIAKDWPRAYALMRRSSLGGLDAAGQSLRQIETYLTPEDRQKGDALLRAFAASPAATVTAVRTAAIARPAATISDAVEVKPARTEPARPVAARPKEQPAVQWKVQLGAFGKIEAARAHWQALAKKPVLAALEPAFVSRDGTFRVQAGPLPNRAAAQRACSAAQAAGSACFALRP